MQLQRRAAVCNPPVWANWSDRLPQRPLCGDILADGIHRRPRTAALSYQHVEFNSAGRLAWLNFDIDTADSFECWERAHLPVPNVYAQNPANGHGHVLYALHTPVGLLGLSHGKPMTLMCRAGAVPIPRDKRFVPPPWWDTQDRRRSESHLRGSEAAVGEVASRVWRTYDGRGRQ